MMTLTEPALTIVIGTCILLDILLLKVLWEICEPSIKRYFRNRKG